MRNALVTDVRTERQEQSINNRVKYLKNPLSKKLKLLLPYHFNINSVQFQFLSKYNPLMTSLP